MFSILHEGCYNEENGNGDMMRLDKFLKNSRLIKRRTVAKQAADTGRVTVNGKVAKAGTEVSVGDELEIRFGQDRVRVEIMQLLETQKKEDAETMYRVLVSSEVSNEEA